MAYLLSGSMCDRMVSPDVQQLGSSFVCGFTDTFFFFCMLMIGAFHVYSMYIIWSAAEEIGRAPFPELQKYSEALMHTYIPHQPPKYLWPTGQPRAAAFHPTSDNLSPQMMPRSYGQAPPQQNNMSYGSAGNNP